MDISSLMSCGLVFVLLDDFGNDGRYKFEYSSIGIKVIDIANSNKQATLV
jgi:hypothetical protein